MNDHSFDEINNVLGGAKHVAIAVGQQPSLDTMAAGLSLYLSLTKAGKSTVILCPTPPTVALGNLVGINKVQKEYGGGVGNGLIISLPYEQGAIEKISYDIVGDRINLTVVPGGQGLGFTTDDITYQSPTQGRADLIIAVAIAQESQLDTMIPDSLQTPLVNIDTSLDNVGYGTVALVDDTYSSTSEIVAKLLTTLALPIDVDIAQNLLSGIIDKTNNFQNAQTSPSAFEITALLMQKGARREGAFLARSTRVGQPLAPKPHTASTPFDQRQSASPFPQRGALKGQQPAANTSPAPKDWLEPKIYSGKTPVS